MSARLLPLFPLPLVLLPGALLPLHVFEPRYRELLRDCLAGEREFGLPYLPQGMDEEQLPTGHVGCVAHLEHVEQLPDGRANIVVTGRERFALQAFESTGAAYHVGRVEPVEDETEDAGALGLLAAEVRERFARIARAARTIADEQVEAPALPEEPGQLAFAIAALVDLEAEDRQRLLASRSPLGRLTQLDAILSAALRPVEERARVHRRAGSNGKGPRSELS